jgi:hypothetical protein
MFGRVIAALALLAAGSAAQEAPGIVWARDYSGPYFSCVRQHWNGTLVAGGYGSAGDLFFLDMEGTLQDCVAVEEITGGFISIEVLPCGDIIACGEHCFTSVNREVVLARFTGTGSLLWLREFNLTDGRESPLDVEPLPDGGFAICGYTEPPGYSRDGLLIRTDDTGDTVWIMTWGWTYNDTMHSIEYVDNGLSVYCSSRHPGATSYQPHLVRFDMEGQMEWMAYDGLSGNALDMCLAQPDGYALMTAYPSVFFYRTDELGDVLWQTDVIAAGMMDIRSISLTQDGGFLVAGSDDELDGEPYYDDPNAHLSRYDADGNHLWTRSIENSPYYPYGIWDPSEFNDAIQLAQGGYVACGAWSHEDASFGYIVRLEPETGIGVLPGRELGLDLNAAVPNPGSTSFTLSWTSVEPGQTSLRFFDLSGRLVDTIEQGALPSGSHTITWEAPDLPSGCYLVLLECGGERASSRLVIIR